VPEMEVAGEREGCAGGGGGALCRVRVRFLGGFVVDDDRGGHGGDDGSGGGWQRWCRLDGGRQGRKGREEGKEEEWEWRRERRQRTGMKQRTGISSEKIVGSRPKLEDDLSLTMGVGSCAPPITGRLCDMGVPFESGHPLLSQVEW
jgi:hypothetical protein